MPTAAAIQEKAYQRRWVILVVLCFSLLVIVARQLDPQRRASRRSSASLDATNSQLQWMVDSYTLVFAGLLLTAGQPRRPLRSHAARCRSGSSSSASARSLSAFADVADAADRDPRVHGHRRRVHHAGDAVDHHQRLPARASAAARSACGPATAGVGVALGPLTGGFLLEHFYWGSIFLVNVPIVVVGARRRRLPRPRRRRTRRAPRLDPVGAVLSIVGLVSLAVRRSSRRPTDGWTRRRDPRRASASASCVLARVRRGGSCTATTRCSTCTFFKNPRFTAASAGDHADVLRDVRRRSFLLTQYLQFVLGYSPLEAGVRLLPVRRSR